MIIRAQLCPNQVTISCPSRLDPRAGSNDIELSLHPTIKQFDQAFTASLELATRKDDLILIPASELNVR